MKLYDKTRWAGEEAAFQAQRTAKIWRQEMSRWVCPRIKKKANVVGAEGVTRRVTEDKVSQVK